jgi:hypothetical protein
MMLTVIKDQILEEAACLLKDNTHVYEVTLDTGMVEYFHIFEFLIHDKHNANKKGAVVLVATPTTKRETRLFPGQEEL